MLKIAHLADIHVYKNTSRHEEYREIFSKLYKKLKELSPDKIVLAGDLYENFIDLEGEALTLLGEFLNNLSTISKVIVTIGNHDYRKKAKNRQSIVKTLIDLIKNNNVVFYEKSGFYLDSDIDVVWAVWDHKDRINPWVELQNNYTDDKIYIDLYHDPLNGCSLYNNQKQNYKISPTDLKGDYSMLGDIHLRQSFLNDTKWYPGSLIQQNFGEKPNNHGFLLWEIEDKKKFKVNEYNIESDYTYINFHINENTDYDNLNFDSEYIRKNSQFKVIWKDYSVNINVENETKILKYLKSHFNIEKVKFEKHRIYSDFKDTDEINIINSVNIYDKQIQKNIFIEYLKNNKISKDDIVKILEVDDIINKRLELNDIVNNVDWKIERIELNNFKSYGDDNVLDWKDNNGIIQITGKNRQGKTTILDGICYVLFGTTLSTNKLGGAKVEKHGDNRYINNKRDLNYCSGKILLNINGERFYIERKTERELTKKKTIKSVNTNVNYYDLKNVLLNEEGRVKTQKLLDSVIGSFEDFIRLTLINADNLNTILSLDRSVFMDSIIRDAGLEIFEKKLEVFKEYQKEEKEKKININLLETEENIAKLNSEIESLIENKNNLELELESYNKDIEHAQTLYELAQSKLHKIDESVSNTNPNSIKNDIEKINNFILKNNTSIETNDKILSEIKDCNFNEEEYEKIISDIKYHESIKQNLKIDIKNIEKIILQEENKIDRIKDKIDELKEKSINNLNDDILKEENKIKEFEKSINDLKNDKLIIINSSITELKNKINIINIEVNNLKNEGLKKLKEIEDLKNSKVCPTCKREYDDISHIEPLIGKLTTEVEDIKNKGISKKNIITSIENDIKSEENKKNNIKQYFPDLNDKLIEFSSMKNELIKYKENVNDIINNIQNNIFNDIATLKENIDKGLNLKKNSIDSIKDCQNKINEIDNQINDIDKKVFDLEDSKYKLESDKKNYERKNKLLLNNKNYKLENENYQFQIEKMNNKIQIYNEQLVKLKENDEIKRNILEIKDKLEKQENKRQENYKNLSDIKLKISYNKDNINNLEKLIDKFKKQQKQELIESQYMKCIHRDGIPTFLLSKSIHLINNKLEELLIDQDYDVFFNDDFKLKMSDDIYNKNVEQNALECSGAERTFVAIALKIALRNINNKSKSDFILLDEVMGKLIEESLDQFYQLLERIKKEINKIIIIEHVHPIDYDYNISVMKNKNKISNWQFN